MGEKGFAIVTGSAKGLGAGMVRQLAKEGYDVLINHVSESSGPKAAALAEEVIKEYGVGAIVFKGDVSSYEVCQDMVKAGVEAFGENLSVLINNAGLTNSNTFESIPHEKYEYLIGVEVLGAMNCTHVALPYMQKNKGGNIIFTSSIGGLLGQVTEAPYSGAKAFLHGFARALARENVGYGIRVNCIAPGLIWTDIFNGCSEEVLAATKASIPMQRFGEIEDVAQAMSYLLSANYVTGQIISPNGGIAMY